MLNIGVYKMREHNVAVIGCGIWGKNVVRNFYNLEALHTVCDLDFDNRQKLKEQYPDVNIISDYNEVLKNTDIEAVAVVTPSHTHYKIVKQAIEAGKHVYVEKPISTVAAEAKSLDEMATSNNIVLMVGHLLMYHPAVNRLKMLINDGVLGDIRYVQSDRLNINHFKNDRSVMWDLAPHDVSMTSYILGKEPIRVISAVGASNIIAHISDSWIHPQKRVNLLVRGTKATAIFDDTLSENKLQIFESSSPKISKNEILDYIEIEPLKLECQHFLNCIENGKTARSDGHNGYNVVKVLEEAEKIMLGEKVKSLNAVNFASSRSKR